MKKTYVKPEAVMISFQYTKVLATSGGSCGYQYTHAATQNTNQGCSKCRDKYHYIQQHS